MKVAEYIERCKKEGWDSDAEQEWKNILHAVAFEERCAKDGILTYDRDCNDIKRWARELPNKLSEIKHFETVPEMRIGLQGLKLEINGILGKIWTDKHTKIVEESEEKFKTHTEGEEVDI